MIIKKTMENWKKMKKRLPGRIEKMVWSLKKMDRKKTEKKLILEN